jgi:pyruvate kinase
MNTSSRAQIVATIGPATKDKDIVRKLVEHQMDVARLNFSWGTYEEHAHYIATIREVGKEFSKAIPIIQDLSGPRVQTKEGHHVDPNAVEVLTEKDLRDLDFGLSQKVEYVCMSYVGTAHDVQRLREEIAKRGGGAKVMAKVERQEALDNIDAIVAASDAIMIGRGDLGQNIPIERVPFAEQMIIQKCKAAKKPVITATQMLVSMVENPEPTRAEVTDIAYAILLGSDAVMLSEETARGKHPVEAVIVMERVVLEAERHLASATINPL